MSIVYTVAEGLKDRRVGQRFAETWTFRPLCRRGPCNVELRRAGRKLLLRRSGTVYTAKKSFTGAFFCNDTTYPRGTTYVETWTVRVRRSGPGPRGRHAVRIAGVGATVGRSSSALPCGPINSREGVELTGVPAQR